MKFWRKIGEILRIHWWNREKNFGKKFMKFSGKFGGILRKIWQNFGETLRTVCWNFKMNLVKYWEKFGEISKENGRSFVENLVKNFEKNLMKFSEYFSEIWKKIDAILERIRLHVKHTLVKFQENFFFNFGRKLTKFCR